MSKSSQSDAVITVAVAGLGRAGWDMHVAQMRGDPRFRIVSVMDPVAERRRQAETELGCRVYAEFEPMLAETAAELIVVASPSALHEAHTIAALNKGRHVICEKPMAINVAQADRMIAATRAAGRQLLIHQNHRLDRTFAFIGDTIAGGKLGTVYHIAMCSHSYRLRSDWQTEAKHGGGELNNAGSHYLDLMLRLLDAPVTEVFGELKHIADAGDAEDYVKILLRAENGRTGDVEICTKAATMRQAPFWTILGDAGAMTIELLDGGEANLKYYDRSAVAAPALQGTLAAQGRKYTPEPNLPWKQEQLTAQDLQARAGKPAGRSPFYEAVYRTLRLGEPFPVQAEQVRQVIDVIGRCRAQNPLFPGPAAGE